MNNLPIESCYKQAWEEEEIHYDSELPTKSGR